MEKQSQTFAPLTGDKIKSLIFGHAIGDALGVPVEFKSRERLTKEPVTEMIGYGTHNVPAGTWSDDTSMTLCLLESMGRIGTVDYKDIMRNFVRWMDCGDFTATGVLFDIGISTRRALMQFQPKSKLIHEVEPINCGGREESDNGNGSLMRISPMALYLYNKSGNNLTAEDLELVHNVSKLTHGHVRSQMACGIYTLIAAELMNEKELTAAVKTGIKKARDFYGARDEFANETKTYNRIWNVDGLGKLPEYHIKSTGYVVDTLEAAVWCLLNTDNYCECVLTAVNLGDDTDTVGAITGGLAGLAYGLKNIPSNWKQELQRSDFIEKLCMAFAEKLHQSEESCLFGNKSRKSP